jgi:hypothetical protein
MESKSEYSIAVLLPTRGRTDALSRSVKGLINRAVTPERVQLMLGFDDDDVNGLEHFESDLRPWLDETGISDTAMSFEPVGYGRLNEYVNELAKNSSADWLFFWNDDALMETTGWDREIDKHTGEFKILAVHTHRDHPYSIFPIVPRAWLDLLGYLSPHQISDAWLSQQAYCLDIMERIEVYVTHDRHDLTGNNNDETFKNRPMYEGNPSNAKDFHHIDWVIKRMDECQRISEYMKKSGLDTTWWDNVKAKTQDPWEKLRENDINKQMVQFQVKYDKAVI